eukprot:CAMPEP_0206182450 /NCGR_PEP_ID=MMETSP0166-20121206/68_1 /ASSEMBLY_ACC=CAM_ASM_000260 /TAXON_ID=95228 /ORGANISM="Vannella robusta, Strain DIVA3 518/3/11/1/6" /LENGTH=155 /DNA_ID=CAMNT_0053597153 /DNA_START=26 /DNA_END=493 /DNA_ORIENTATION=-
MQIFVKALSGTHTLEVESNECVEQLRQRIQELEGIPCEDQRLSVATSTLVDGRSLSEFGVEDLSVVELSLTLEGGRKKKKKKTYTKPKKIKHKHKKEKLAVLKYYKVDPRTHKIERLKRECTHPDCGPGVFMANHFDRQYCGKCHLTYMGINKDQ